MFTGVLIISFTLLSAALTKCFNSYFINQKKDMLIEQGKKISKVFEQAYYFGGLYNKEKLNSEITILDKYLDASFLYVDEDKSIVMISNDLDASLLGQKLNLSKFNSIIEGNIISFQGTMNGIFDKPVFTVGYPVIITGQAVGAIFMNSPMTELQKSMKDIYKIMIISICLSILIGFLLIFISSKNISKPLLEMNDAAKVIANGDFEKRLKVKSVDEISQLAESFNEMAESLYEQEKNRREFLSNISHDLRSPLTSMRGFLQAIIDGTIPKEKQEHYLNIVLEESERLAILANNILDINKLSEPNAGLQFSDFELNDMIKKTIFNFETRVLEKNINLNVKFDADETFVNADYEKIQRVIYNLVDNAIKFTDKNGEIDVETIVKDKKVFIKVKDNGIGISQEDQKKIFDRFYKVDASRGMDKKGTGLGLSIVKQFINAHGEEITLKSEEEKGCEFEFSLKLSKKQ